MNGRSARFRYLALPGILAIAVMACTLTSLTSGGSLQTQPPKGTRAASVNATETPSPITSPAATSERGTPDEARAMLQKALEHYTSVGREQALADFTGRVTPFFDRDLYVVCVNSAHIETANGGFPQYVGSSADAVSDANGKPLGKTIWETASVTETNAVNYRWVNPVSGKTEPKVLFFRKVGTDVCGVGAYRPS